MEENDITIEEWRPIPGYEGKYDASSGGRIRSLKRMCGSRWGSQRTVPARVLKQKLNRTGYYVVDLCRGSDDHKTRTVHRLVVLAFHGPPTDKPVVRHLDGSRTNNSITNLVWGSHKENADDRAKHGKTSRGEKCGNAKLTEAEVLQIRAEHAGGATQVRLGAKFGVTHNMIGYIVRRKSWAHVV